jgi:hypothetical protein
MTENIPPDAPKPKSQQFAPLCRLLVVHQQLNERVPTFAQFGGSKMFC